MAAASGTPVIDGMGAVVDQLDALSVQKEVTVRDIVSAFGDASFLPLMMIPALLVVSPLSGVPLFSSICGITIGLVAVQMLSGRRHVWLPGFVMRRKLKGVQLHRAVQKIRKSADWLDSHARRRLRLLFHFPLKLIPQILCVLSGFSMPFLELLPFSSSLLGAAVCLMSVGFLVRDGLYTIGGFAFVSIAASIPFAVAGTIVG